jgi:hypothetical protein
MVDLGAATACISRGNYHGCHAGGPPWSLGWHRWVAEHRLCDAGVALRKISLHVHVFALFRLTVVIVLP